MGILWEFYEMRIYQFEAFPSVTYKYKREFAFLILYAAPFITEEVDEEKLELEPEFEPPLFFKVTFFGKEKHKLFCPLMINHYQ